MRKPARPAAAPISSTANTPLPPPLHGRMLAHVVCKQTTELESMHPVAERSHQVAGYNQTQTHRLKTYILTMLNKHVTNDTEAKDVAWNQIIASEHNIDCRGSAKSCKPILDRNFVTSDKLLQDHAVCSMTHPSLPDFSALRWSWSCCGLFWLLRRVSARVRSAT